MKILVTGGTGYIGSHVVVELLNAGHKAIIVDNLSNSNENVLNRIFTISRKSPKFYKGDVRDSSFLDTVFAKESDIDGIIHFAAFKSVGESAQKPLKYYNNNLNGLVNVLEISKKYNVTNFVFSSSATVYGEPEKNPIPESTNRKPATNPYGNTKAIAEDVLRDLVLSGANLKTIALRYFNPIGAHPSGLIGELPLGTPNNLVPFITQTAAGIRDELSVFGDDYPTIDGTGVRDYIHVIDLANAHIKTLEFLKEQKKPLFDVYNVGTGKGASVMQLIKTFEKVSGQSLPYKIVSRRAGDIAECFADTKKIEKTMNWKAEKTIEEALRDSWRWQKNCIKDN